MEAPALVLHLGAWSVGKGALQHKLVRALMRSIKEGAIAPGIRLPSERTLAQALTVSRTTVVAAYDALREAGWLESRPGSRTRVAASSAVVQAARGSAHAAALASSPLLGMLSQREESGIIDFALGAPHTLPGLSADLLTLPPDDYAALLRDRLYYPLGLPLLRQAIAAEITAEGLPSTAGQILVTNGAQQAISLCAALCLQRGDTALIEDPSYFGALDVFRATGARLAPLPLGRHGVVPAVLRERCIASAARLIYLTAACQNPTGIVMPSAARREIARTVAALNVPLIDDRTLAGLVLDGPDLPPLAAFAPAAGIFTVGSISKLIWPGLRVGWVRAPEPSIERLARLKSASDLGSPLLTQAVAARLLTSVSEARRLRRAQLLPRRDRLAALLRRLLPSWSFQLPAGGLFLWVELPAGDSREFAQLALRHGVAVIPGPAMSATESSTRRLRIPFFWEAETLVEGVRRLAAAWREYQPAESSVRTVLV